MENLLLPYRCVKQIFNGDALVFAPHPDDEVFGCGGAIMRHIEHGNMVSVVVVTSGGAQPGNDAAENRSYIESRQKESLAAAEVLGYKNIEYLPHGDRSLVYSERLVSEVSRLIEKYSPDIVYAPSPYEVHPDHVATSLSVIEGFRRNSSVSRLVLYEVGSPLSPNILLDITDIKGKKISAMRCFTSQLEIQRYDKHIEGLNNYRAYTLPKEIESAEAYYMVDRDGLNNFYSEYFSSEYEKRVRKGLPVSGNCNDGPLVSVLIRSIGRKSLKETLQSVALQTYQNIEAVVVNAEGLRQEHPGEMCGSAPLKYIDSDGRKSRSEAANLALSNASGDYLIFLDDDDQFDPDHIESLVAATRVNPESKAFYSGVRCIDTNGEIIDIMDSEYDPIRLLVGNYLPINSVLFSKELVETGCRYDETIELYEDWDFWLQVSRLTDFKKIKKLSASYRITDGAGFGMQASKQDQDHYRSIILQKWRNTWSENELLSIGDAVDEKRLLAKQVKQLENALVVEHDESVRLGKELATILHSKSWILTKPLRLLNRLIRR